MADFDFRPLVWGFWFCMIAAALVGAGITALFVWAF